MARERYLWNAGEETIHDSSQETMPMTAKKKRENFWYYHKWHVLVGVFCVFLIGMFVFEMVNQEESDYEIAFLTQSTFSEDDLKKIKAQIESIADDRNGDGKVIVTFNQYYTGASGSSDTGMSNLTKITNDLSSNQSLIYFVDNNSLNTYQQSNPQLFAYADGSTPAKDATDFDHLGVKWKDCPFLSSIDLKETFDLESGGQKTIDMQQLFEDLNVCIRSKSPSLDENTKEAERYQAYFNLYQQLTQ